MERFTISLDEKLAREFDALIRLRGYGNRSEAVRDILRRYLETHRLQAQAAPWCVASVSYVYNHHERELSERLTEVQHAHHDLVISSMHAHLDHEHCIETVILRGPTAQVQQLADALVAERGVRHGQTNLVPVDVEQGGHAHHHASHPLHVHARPKT